MKIKLWKGTDEEFIKSKGWVKKKGYRIDTELISEVDHFRLIYFEDLSDFVQKAEYWEHPTHSESVYEEVESVIEQEYEFYLDEDGILYEEPLD